MVFCVPIEGYFDSNCYFWLDPKTGHGCIIDPGAQAEDLLRIIRKNEWTIERILLTHGHIDHIGAVNELRDVLKVPVMAHKTADVFLNDPEMNLSAPYGPPYTVQDVLYLDEGDVIHLEADPDFCLNVIYVPGHTIDSVIYFDAKSHQAFVGDTIYKGSPGDYDYPGGDYRQLIRSIIDKVLKLPGDTVLYTGHSDPTTVAAERGLYPDVR